MLPWIYEASTCGVSAWTLSYHLPERYNRVKYLAREDMRDRCRPLPAVADVVSGVPLSILVDAYQH